MIYRCWCCGWRINQRTSNSDGEIFHTDVRDEDIGKHLMYDHVPFCSVYCIDDYRRMKKKPMIAPKADWDEDRWKVNRKINRCKEC